MDDFLIDLIEEIESVKTAAKVHPTHATHTDLIKRLTVELNKGLNKLYADGKIEVGNTIHTKWVKIKR